jgi:hypothetical protein
MNDLAPPLEENKTAEESSEHFHHLQADLRACGINLSGGAVDANMLESMLFTWCHNAPDHHVPKPRTSKHAMYTTRGHGLASLLLPYYENQLQEYSIGEDLMLPDKGFVQDSVTARVFPIPPNLSILHVPHQTQYELTPETWKEMLARPEAMLNYRKAVFHFFDIVGLSRNLHDSVGPGQKVLIKAFRDFGQDKNEGSAFRLARLFLRVLASTYFLDEEAHVRLASLFDASLLRDLCKGSTSSLCHMTKAFSYSEFLRTLTDMHTLYKKRTPRSLGREMGDETSDASDAEEDTEVVRQVTPVERLSTPEERQATPEERQATPEERQVTPEEERQVTPEEERQVTLEEERQVMPEERQVTLDEERQVMPEERQVTLDEERQVTPEDERQVTPEEERQVTPEEERQVTPEEERQVTPEEERQVTPEERQVTPEEERQATLEEERQSTPEERQSTPVVVLSTPKARPQTTTPVLLSTPVWETPAPEKQAYVDKLQQETKRGEIEAETDENPRSDESLADESDTPLLELSKKQPPTRKKRSPVPPPISRGTSMLDPRAAENPVDISIPIMLSPPQL